MKSSKVRMSTKQDVCVGQVRGLPPLRVHLCVRSPSGGVTGTCMTKVETIRVIKLLQKSIAPRKRKTRSANE